MNENLIGYIFPSRDGGFMIDTGPLEYPSSMIESFEIWDGTKFVAAREEGYTSSPDVRNKSKIQSITMISGS